MYILGLMNINTKYTEKPCFSHFKSTFLKSMSRHSISDGLEAVFFWASVPTVA